MYSMGLCHQNQQFSINIQFFMGDYKCNLLCIKMQCPSVVVHSNFSMWKVEAGGLWVRIQPGIFSEFKASPCYKSKILFQQNKIHEHGVWERAVEEENDQGQSIVRHRCENITLELNSCMLIYKGFCIKHFIFFSHYSMRFLQIQRLTVVTLTKLFKIFK